jgi:hypothetical protein
LAISSACSKAVVVIAIDVIAVVVVAIDVMKGNEK